MAIYQSRTHPHPSPHSSIGPGTALALIVLASAIGLTACDARSSTSALGSPNAKPSATADPSPSASGTDVAAAFAAESASQEYFNAVLTGSLRIGELHGVVTGSLEVARDGAMHTVTIVAIPGVPESRSEEISLGGQTYTLTPRGYWLQAAPAGSGSNPIGKALSNTESIEVVGTKVIDGEPYFLLASSNAPPMTPDALGITDPSVTDFEGAVAYLAEDDGTPVGVLLTGSWTQGQPDAQVEAEMELRYLRAPGVPTVRAPSEVWVREESPALAYALAHPIGWQMSSQPAGDGYPALDYYVGRNNEEVDVYLYTETNGALGNAWFNESRELIVQDFGVTPTEGPRATLADGAEYQLFSLSCTCEGESLFFQQAVVFAGDVAWDLNWYSSPGNEEADAARFLQIVQSFERVPGP